MPYLTSRTRRRIVLGTTAGALAAVLPVIVRASASTDRDGRESTWDPIPFDRSTPTVPILEYTVTSADGTAIAAQEYGLSTEDAPTIVLLHGYPNSHAVWFPILPLLVDEFHVLTFDMRGVGKSGKPSNVEDYVLDRLDEDFAAVVDGFAPGKRVHYVGHDFGGVIGWDLLAKPELSSRIASFTTFGAPSFDMFGGWFRRHLATGDVPFGLLDILNQMLRIPEFWGYAAKPVVSATWAKVPGSTSIFDAVVRRLNRISGEPREANYPNVDGYHAGLAYTANFTDRVINPRYVRLPEGTPPVQSLEGVYDRFFSNEFQASMDSFGTPVVRRHYNAGHWGIATTANTEIAELITSWVWINSSERVRP